MPIFFLGKNFFVSCLISEIFRLLDKTHNVFCRVAKISKRSDNIYFLTPHVTNREVFLLATLRYAEFTNKHIHYIGSIVHGG